MFIRSERLFLRPGWPEDWQELLGKICDERIVRHLARAPWPYGPEDARRFASMEQDRRTPNFFVTAPSSEGTRLVGSCGLGLHEGQVELGYWIARDDWGRGYATEAARAVLKLARTLGHRRIVASHFEDNPASGRVLQKVGFRPTGEVRPRYSLARDQIALAVVHAIDLGAAEDCDNGDGDGAGQGAGQGMARMRAA